MSNVTKERVNIMSKNKFLKKLLAIILIFTLTFANFAFTTKSYASSLAEVIFGETSDTGSNNVSFDAFFETEVGNSASVISDVNNKDLFISIGLNVRNKGYLKDAKISIAETEPGKGINFDVRQDVSESSKKLETEEEISSTDQNNIVPIEDSEEVNETTEEQNENLLQEEILEQFENEVLNSAEEVENQNVSQIQEENNVQNEAQEIESSENTVTDEMANIVEESTETTGEPENQTETVEEAEISNSEVSDENIQEEPEIQEESQEKTINQVIESEEHIEKFENNTFYLNQVAGDSEVKIEVPIEYKNEEFVNENQFSNDCKIIFSGIFVDNEGEEVEVSKEVTLNVSWKDEKEINTESEATKYIDYGAGVILQTVERINNESEEKTLPVKATEIEINVPTLKEAKPSKITVVANSLEATNGEGAGEVEFSEDNWEYNAEENKLIIKVENTKQKVEVKENEGEYLQEGETKEEERYYNGTGIDEYLVTYTYENVEVGEEEKVTVGTNVTTKMTTVSGVEGENNETTVTENKEYNYELQGKAGDIVSLNKENKKGEISKAYTYVNYNNAGKYETEIGEEVIVNISYKDIVEGIEVKDERNEYVDKAGNRVETGDIYYKRISIAKENFDSILGETGEVKVKDEAGNVIAVVNKDSSVNEAGNIEIGFEGRYGKLSFEISKPAGEGNLVISTVKAINGAGVDKQTYINIDRISTSSSITAKYSYVEGAVEVGTVETSTKLVDTNTEANLVIDRESLSTIEENKDVEMRIELNNARETSDIYGHSEFEIVLPENIESVEVTNVSMLYGEGLEITGSEVNGKTIRVIVDGKQEGINSGVLTNGTNIVIKANIKVNLYTPAKTENIVMRYTNSEATNYVDGGYKEVGMNYSAPTGLVAVNTVSNYDDNGTVTTSVRQGKKEGILNVYAQGREVTTEIIVMNNNSNTVSEMKILGRVPHVGVKDIQTGEELGTTIESKMASLLIGDERNRGTFKIYYSENGEATQDLSDGANGWTETPANIENIKSYLIIPEDTNYHMGSSEVLRFTYTYTIPENLPHNEYSYGTFGVYYKNNSEVAKTNEVSVADLVGLTTGVGPELNVTVTPSREQVKEYEEFYLDIVVENIGEVVAENVNIDIIYENKANYSRYESNKEDIMIEDITSNLQNVNSNGEIEFFEIKIGNKITVSDLEVGEKLELKLYLIANQLGTITYFDGENIDWTQENPDTGELIVEKLESDIIDSEIKVTANDLGTEMKLNSKVTVFPAEMSITEHLTNADRIEKAGKELEFTINIKNENKDSNMTNVIVSKEIPPELIFKSATGNYSYDENTRILTWRIDTLESRKNTVLQMVLEVNELSDNINKTTIDTFTTVKADNTDTYTSNTISISIAKPVLEITQTSDNTNTYIKEGETLNYTFLVKNVGEVSATFVNLSNVIPDGIGITNVKYTINGVETNRTGVMKDNITITTNIDPGAELLVNLEAVALSLNGAEEKSVTNYATVNSKEIDEIKSNEITYIVESAENSGSNTQNSYTLADGNNIEKTYRISGVAWFDANQNGMRDSNEELLSNITAKLVDSSSGVIQNTQTTDSNGEYVFSGVKNGTYLIVFEYDSTKYIVTTYQKEGVVSNVNSDVILTTINQEGQSKEGAVTDIIKIEGGSISNIDIGLMSVDKFDLQIDKAISKVMLQTSNETTTEEYDNTKLAKTEVAAKYVSASTVYVEYNITVSNVGDIKGYARKIVDYIPEGMTFNSALEANADWYTGSDGNLYSEALANRELNPGDSVTLKLVLTKQMNEENTGIINNQVEIYEDYNTYGISDMNSVPGNKAQNENDLSSADLIVSIKTGEVFIYISIIITSILLGSIIVFITYSKLKVSKRKWVI